MKKLVKALFIHALLLSILFAMGFGTAFGLACRLSNERFEDKDIYLHVNKAQNRSEIVVANTSFHVFPVARFDPIKYYDSLKVSWVKDYSGDRIFELNARPGEYFVFQVGFWAINRALDGIRVEFSDFESTDGKIISRQNMTCFNLEGIDLEGDEFVKQVNVEKGRVQALWNGLDLEAVPVGLYHGEVRVGVGQEMKTLKLKLIVEGETAINHGYDEAKGLSRMAWLNTKTGLNEKHTDGFIPIERQGHQLDVLGRTVWLSENGLPKAITSYFEPSVQFLKEEGLPLINAPFRFVIEKENGEQVQLNPGNLEFTTQTSSGIGWQVTNTSADCNLRVEGQMEFDGFIDYRVTVTANTSLSIKDIRLEVPLTKSTAKYMMGLNHEGGLRPQEWHWQWDTNRNQDMLWVGAVNGGMRLKWKAENYRRPLVNIYYSFHPIQLPPSWGNAGQGGVSVKETNEEVMIKAFSGTREMSESEQLHYDFELLLTPFKVMNKQVKYGDRYFHGGGRIADEKVKMADEAGANIINIHHAEDIYPFINYPYLDENRVDIQHLVDAAHSDKKRLKLYYTTRELTINTPEFWAFRSLNGEITYPGPGNESKTLLHKNGPHTWLKENLREKYIPAWYNPIPEGKFKGAFDMSVITTPDSRLNNFYIGGLHWMVRNLGIDGVYIDDSALDRITVRRARKIIDSHRPNGRIDFHSWNHFNEHAGFANCLNMYMDLLPYIDLVWIGEGRDYDRMPDHWLVEVSGIPFGLPGQMLQDGGNPWRGMVYGMTNRAGWGGDPTHIWRFWDDFDIEDKQMVGYWDKHSPLKIDNPLIKATLFKGHSESIIAVANWDKKDQKCSIQLNWEVEDQLFEIESSDIPFIEDFQEADLSPSLDDLKVPGGKGFLIVLKHKSALN